jgi:hypothetical protein
VAIFSYILLDFTYQASLVFFDLIQTLVFKHYSRRILRYLPTKIIIYLFINYYRRRSILERTKNEGKNQFDITIYFKKFLRKLTGNSFVNNCYLVWLRSIIFKYSKYDLNTFNSFVDPLFYKMNHSIFIYKFKGFLFLYLIFYNASKSFF